MSRTELQQAVIECQDNLEFMAGLDDGVSKLIVTSPPYNLGKSYESSRESLQVGNYVENGEIVPLDTFLYPVFISQRLKLRNRIVWHFGHGLHCTRLLSGRYETINWWTKGDDYTWNLNPIPCST